MLNSNEAEENLRVIRGLMERSTIYRAISAPTALVGGLLSVAAALYSVWRLSHENEALQTRSNQDFLILWIFVLFLTLLYNTYSLWAKAQRMKEPFLSAGLKLACRMAFPSYITAAVISIILTGGLGTSVETPGFVILWLICHGLGLLSTQAFAPKSIFFLGWAFLASGLIYFGMVIDVSNIVPEFLKSISWIANPLNALSDYMPAFREYVFSAKAANLVLGLTFGGYHLVYACLTWPRGGNASLHLEELSLE